VVVDSTDNVIPAVIIQTEPTVKYPLNINFHLERSFSEFIYLPHTPQFVVARRDVGTNPHCTQARRYWNWTCPDLMDTPKSAKVCA
jgi:hypothetical protein